MSEQVVEEFLEHYGVKRQKKKASEEEKKSSRQNRSRDAGERYTNKKIDEKGSTPLSKLSK